jgi:hypothetical protein
LDYTGKKPPAVKKEEVPGIRLEIVIVPGAGTLWKNV